MGNLMKINMYLDSKKAKNKNVDISRMKANFTAYSEWLEQNNMLDVKESYEMFLIIK